MEGTLAYLILFVQYLPHHLNLWMLVKGFNNFILQRKKLNTILVLCVYQFGQANENETTIIKLTKATRRYLIPGVIDIKSVNAFGEEVSIVERKESWLIKSPGKNVIDLHTHYSICLFFNFWPNSQQQIFRVISNTRLHSIP